MPGEPRLKDFKNVNIDSINGDNTVLSKKTEAAQQYYTEEKSRTKTIEGKASMFITSTGFLGTVLIGTSNILVGQKVTPIWFKLMLVVCLIIFAIYMVRTILFSLKALSRSTYSRPDPISVMDIGNKDSLDKQVIVDLINSTLYNQHATNLKMDYVVVAQRYFKRLMITVLAFVVVLLVYVLQQNGVSLFAGLTIIKEEINTWTFQFWYVLISTVLILVSMFIGIVALFKINHIQRVSKTQIELD